VEFAFGGRSELPAWEVPLGNGRKINIQGRIDRIDLRRITDDEALCVIIDYKAGAQKPDRTLLHHGIQQQLTAYLLAMTRIPEIAARFGYRKLHAAGCFLLPLRARFEPGRTRTEALAGAQWARKAAYTHNGLFDVSRLEELDKDGPEEQSGQFKYKINKDGAPNRGLFSALSTEHFQEVLARSEKMIQEAGEEIYAGEIGVEPFKRSQATACDKCKMLAVCRFDSWTQPFKALTPPPKTGRKK
jgi:ATP-dependent helicase/nuclease subunit B